MPLMLGKAAYSTPCVSYVFFLNLNISLFKKSGWIKSGVKNKNQIKLSRVYNVSQMSVNVL